MNKPIKSLFVIYSIEGGGAERQMSLILKSIDRKRFKPCLALFKLKGNESTIVPSDIPVYDLSTKFRPASVFLALKLFLLAKRIGSERIISFMWGVNIISLIAGITARIPVIVSERIYTPSSIAKYSFLRIRKALISFLYRRSAAIIAVSNDVKEGLVNYFKIPPELVTVIPNGIDAEAIEQKSREYTVSEHNYVLGCGSIETKKNFSLLVNAMSKIPSKKLVILGDGPQKTFIKRSAEGLNVELILPGFLSNPYPYFKNADVFVLSSEFEGFPNVLLEAMICKVPVVAVDCAGGIREIIRDGIDGIIVKPGGPQAIAEAVLEIVGNPGLSTKLTESARMKVESLFTLKRMVSAYENLITRSISEVKK